MNTASPAEPSAPQAHPAERVPLPFVPMWELFVTFLIIGATSFGGGVVAYLRNALVLQKGWLDEEHFLSALEISQALPGLNATNMAIIVGDRLRGVMGSIIAFLGITLPGAVMVMVLGVLYASNAKNPYVNAALIGVGAAAVGMLTAVTFQIGRKQFGKWIDIAIIVVTVVLINYFHVSLIWVLLTVGPIAIYIYRPSKLEPLDPPAPSAPEKGAAS